MLILEDNLDNDDTFDFDFDGESNDEPRGESNDEHGDDESHGESNKDGKLPQEVGKQIISFIEDVRKAFKEQTGIQLKNKGQMQLFYAKLLEKIKEKYEENTPIYKVFEIFFKAMLNKKNPVKVINQYFDKPLNESVILSLSNPDSEDPWFTDKLMKFNKWI